MPISESDRQFMEQVAAQFRSTKSEDRPDGSVNETAVKFGLNRSKVRKILVTTGDLKSNITNKAVRLRRDGLSIREIAEKLEIPLSTVSSYLPYEDEIHGMAEPSEAASEMRSYRERRRAREKLIAELSAKQVNSNDGYGEADSLNDEYTRDLTWNLVKAYENAKFKTAGRGDDHKGAVSFTYEMKRSRRTGKTTDELIISTKEEGKTITRSTVELALKKALEVQRAEGGVSGPKKIGGFGSSYLYAMFLKWKLISKG